MRRLTSRLAFACAALVAGVSQAMADVAEEPTEPTILAAVIVALAVAGGYFGYRYLRRRK